MDANFVSSTQFTVVGDYTSEFSSGRRIKADCVGDGYVYGTVVSSSYSSPNTTVTIADGTLTSNLLSVLYGIVNIGSEGSFPKHDHSSSEGQGGQISLNDLTDVQDYVTEVEFTSYSGILQTQINNKPDILLELVDTPSAYDNGKYLKSTSSGTEWATVTGESGASTFLELTDTPTTYSGVQEYMIKVTASGLEFDLVSRWYAGMGDPSGATGIVGDYYVKTGDYSLWRKGSSWVEDSGTPIYTWDIGSNDDGTAGGIEWSGPTDNGDYYTFDNTTNCIYWGSAPSFDETAIDIKVRFRIHNKNRNATQNIWGNGITNGIAIGMDSSNNLGLFGRSGGSLTSITIPNSSYEEDTWYILYAAKTRILLLEDGTENTVEATGSVTPAAMGNYMHIGYFLNSASPIDGNSAGQFEGDVDYVIIYNENDLDFPSYSYLSGSWSSVGSVTQHNDVSFLDLSDTPSSFSTGNYMRMTSSGIQSVDGIILTASDSSEWVLKVTTSGTLYTEAV